MGVKEVSYQIGDRVWLWKRRRRTGRKLKWVRCYTGPYVVLERLGPMNYHIRRSNRTDPIVVHVDKLKPYIAETNGCQVFHEPNERNGTENPVVRDEVLEDTNNGLDSPSDISSVESSPEVVSHRRPRTFPRLPARYRD